MIVKDIMELYDGEVRVYNLYNSLDVGIINTQYKGWVKNSYANCDVVKLELEMLNTAVLSARIVVIIDDANAGQDSGDTEEATNQDIKDLMDSIYQNDQIPTDTETIDVITDDYYDDQPLDGDDRPKPTPNDTAEEVVDTTTPAATEPETHGSDDSEDGVEEATAEDIANLLGGIYS